MNNVLFFLKEKGWEYQPIERPQQRFTKLKPPKDLGFDDGFSFYVFKSKTQEEFDNISLNSDEPINDIEYAIYLIDSIKDFYKDEKNRPLYDESYLSTYFILGEDPQDIYHNLRRKASFAIQDAMASKTKGEEMEHNKNALYWEIRSAAMLFAKTKLDELRAYTFRSASCLALECGDYENARMLANAGIFSCPETPEREEMQEILKKCE